jgi:hypothetical protein
MHHAAPYLLKAEKPVLLKAGTRANNLPHEHVFEHLELVVGSLRRPRPVVS